MKKLIVILLILISSYSFAENKGTIEQYQVIGLVDSFLSVWVGIDAIDTDLENYYTKSEVDDLITDKAKNEVPNGNINGVNDAFTILHTPEDGEIELYNNGIYQYPVYDYSISGTTITFESGSIPQSGDLLITNYEY